MKNLRETVEQELPMFASDILEPFTNELQKDINDFSTIRYWNACAIININDVIGTMHPNYAGKSWLNLLQNGRRMNINLPLLADNPNYYTETTPKVPPMYFILVNGKLYIGSDGNHRTCIAKFFLNYIKTPSLGGVCLEEYVIDYSFKNLYEKCLDLISVRRLPLRCQSIRTLVNREDTAGKMEEYYKLAVIITNVSNFARYEMDAQDMQLFISESENFFRKFTGKFKKLWRS